MTITEKIKTERVYFDGGMGTMLQKRGLPAGTPPESFNLTHPHEVQNVHLEYLDAGCDIITANTFGINTLKYSEEQAEAMIKAAFDCVHNAQKLCKRKTYCALDIGSLGVLLQPYGKLDFEEAVKIFTHTIKAGVKYGADLVLIETMTDSYETRAAVIAAKENSNLPIFVTNVFDSTSHLMTGADIPAMVAMLEGLRVDALGMNCSLGPEQMKGLVKDFCKVSSTPVIVQPNAGLPREENGSLVYDIDADKYSDIMVDIAKSGACILGGCCGTDPEYIKKTIEKTREIPYIPMVDKDLTVISSYTHALQIGNIPVLIGERVNPTGKPKLKEALRLGDLSYLQNEALAQENAGAHALDVNVGLPEIDEPRMMENAIRKIQAVCALPLQIDTVNAEAMERGLRVYNGKPLINSVNGSRESMDKVLPLAAKYGGVLIALTMDETGIPDNAEGRYEIACRIVKEAQKYGIQKKDIIFDPLALTVSSDKNSAKVTIDSIKIIKEKLNMKTSLGVSNISFGLPNRDFVTSTFFCMAMEAGLDCAIMNPHSTEMMKTYRSYLALKGFDDNFTEYISFASDVSSVLASKEQNVKKKKSVDTLEDMIARGLVEAAGKETAKMLQNTDPMDIINNSIIPALNIVGEGFESKRVFLPELLAAAEAAQAAFAEIKKVMPKRESSGKRIILATVKGDIHDIGKNIVRVLLENFGFEVIDLGRDVPKQTICDKARDYNVSLVGLSALMTTTVPAMAETIKLLNEQLPKVKVVVGGAVMTQEYADRIGADKYAADAMETVRYAQELFGED